MVFMEIVRFLCFSSKPSWVLWGFLIMFPFYYCGLLLFIPPKVIGDIVAQLFANIRLLSAMLNMLIQQCKRNGDCRYVSF
ncbi:MAG: hypothetical protein LBE12_10210 [Planctomycetaceae bacterium]|nr:hypothetical protein [Planctomycetaceae bacterium]